MASSSYSSSSKKRPSPEADFNAHFDAHVPTKLSDYDFRPDVVNYTDVPEDKRIRTLVLWMRNGTNGPGDTNDAFVNIITAKRAVYLQEKMANVGPNERNPYVVSERIPLHYAATGAFPKFNHFGNWATAAVVDGCTIHKGHETEFNKAKREARYSIMSTGGTAATVDGLFNAAAKADADLLEEWQNRFFEAIPKHMKLKKLLLAKQEAKARDVIAEEVAYLEHNKNLAGPQLLARLPSLKKMLKISSEQIKSDKVMCQMYSEHVHYALDKLRYSLVKEDAENNEFYLNMRSKIGRKLPDNVSKDSHASLRAPEGMAPKQVETIPEGYQLHCPPMFQFVEGTDNAWQPIPCTEYFVRRGDIVSPLIELSVSVTSTYVGFVLKTVALFIFKRATHVIDDIGEAAVGAMGGTIMSSAEAAAIAAKRAESVQGCEFGSADDDMGVLADECAQPPRKRNKVS